MSGELHIIYNDRYHAYTIVGAAGAMYASNGQPLLFPTRQLAAEAIK
jgi:hypothetical protein